MAFYGTECIIITVFLVAEMTSVADVSLLTLALIAAIKVSTQGILVTRIRVCALVDVYNDNNTTTTTTTTMCLLLALYECNT